MWRPSRRQLMVSGGAAAASAGLLPVARAQGLGIPEMRIATIFPARTGLSTVRTSINDYPGDGGRMGAILGETAIGEEANALGTFLDVLLANSPSPEAARRAADRMIEIEDICAIIGGVGEGQAEVLSEVAGRAGVPFFNVGSSVDALRQGACNRFTFHVEASAAMYLDALAELGASADHRRWFLVYEDTDDGKALQRRAMRAIERHGAGGATVGGAAVEREQPVYVNEVNLLDHVGSDVVLLLLPAIDQIAFLNQMETLGVMTPALTFPDVVSQTRDYIAAARFQSEINNPRYRVASWETTVQTNGAAAFNNRFMGRWSEPVDPTAWASFAAVRILWETVKAVGSLDSMAIVEHLESPAAVFDVMKGPGVSFRPWDHQLRQPLYLVSVDQQVEWVRTELSTRVAIASLAGEFPKADTAGDVVAQLDAYGDGPEDSTCRF